MPPSRYERVHHTSSRRHGTAYFLPVLVTSLEFHTRRLPLKARGFSNCNNSRIRGQHTAIGAECWAGGHHLPDVGGLFQCSFDIQCRTCFSFLSTHSLCINTPHSEKTTNSKVYKHGHIFLSNDRQANFLRIDRRHRPKDCRYTVDLNRW
jgi:hypothetical protein